jgi:transcriptional regulator with XRE-family HTH domain
MRYVKSQVPVLYDVLRPMAHIGVHIRQFRGLRRMSQEQVAQSLDVRTATVSDWETGKTTPTEANVAAIAGVLGLTVEDLRRGPDTRGMAREPQPEPYGPSANHGGDSAPVALPTRLEIMAKELELDALKLGADADEMAWLRMNLYEPQTAKLFQMGRSNRHGTEAERIEHFESFLKGLRANLEAQMALRLRGVP